MNRQNQILSGLSTWIPSGNREITHPRTHNLRKACVKRILKFWDLVQHVHGELRCWIPIPSAEEIAADGLHAVPSLATVEIIFHCTYSFNIGKPNSHLWIQERNRRECKDIGKVLFRYIVHTYASSKDFVVEMVSAMRVVFWDLYFGSSASAAMPQDCPYLPGPNLVSLANETKIGCSHGVPFVQEQSVVPIKRISWVLSLVLAKHKTGCHQPVNGK